MIPGSFIESQLEGRGWAIERKMLIVEPWFARRFSRARRALGLTPKELAGVLNWKTSSIADIEQGKLCHARRRESIEKAVDFFVMKECGSDQHQQSDDSRPPRSRP